MAYDPDAYRVALEAAAVALKQCNGLCATEYCQSQCIKNYTDQVKEANALYNTPESPHYGTVKESDLLLIGREGSSYQVPLVDSGVATLDDVEAGEQHAISVATELVGELEASTSTELASEIEARELADENETEARISADNTEAEAREAADDELRNLITDTFDFAQYDELP